MFHFMQVSRQVDFWQFANKTTLFWRIYREYRKKLCHFRMLKIPRLIIGKCLYQVIASTGSFRISERIFLFRSQVEFYVYVHLSQNFHVHFMVISVYFKVSFLGHWLLRKKNFVHLQRVIYSLCFKLNYSFNRSSQRKRGLASNPLFIIPGFSLHFPLELSYGYLWFEGNGKIPLGRQGKRSLEGRAYSKK